ncbi:MAG: glycosyltransferase [Flavobacteriales bacterium]
MQKRNILFLSSWYPNRIKPTHGNFVYQHALAAAQFHQVQLIYVCLEENRKDQIEYVRESDPFESTIAYIPKSTWPIIGPIWNYLRIVWCYLQLFRQLKKEGFHPELIHANVVYPIGMIARLLSLRYNIPYIITEHWTCYHPTVTPRPSRIQQWLTRLAANKAKLILPVSEDLAKAMRNSGIDCPMEVVYNVIDTDLFVPGEASIKTGFQLIHVSSLDPKQKNPSLLFRAFSELLHQIPTLQLHIVSDGDEGVFKEEILRLKIENHVFFYGTLDAKGIASRLKEADLFVLTSRFENLPCVLIEAISAGVPIVATDVGGIKEIVHAENGVLVPSENQEALVTAIKEELTRLASYQSNQMHQEAVAKFSYRSIGLKFSEIYESILKRHGS